jgi:outer membrane protein
MSCMSSCVGSRRVSVAFLLCSIWVGVAAAQQDAAQPPDYSRNPEWFPNVLKPYQVTKVPTISLTNSPSLQQMARDGRLELSLAQLKNLVLENNLDIMATTNSSKYSQTDMLRAKAGGAPRGAPGLSIPSSLFSGAIGAGVGGGTGLGSFSAAAITGGARQVSASPRGSYDPTLVMGFSLDRTTSPLNSIRVSGVPITQTSSVALQARFSQAFTTGTSLSIAFNNMRQRSTQLNLIYNPDLVSAFTATVTQQLLNGFGTAVGRRFVEVAKNEVKYLEQSLRLQLNTSLASAQTIYWDVVAARDNVGVATQSLEVAKRLYEDNRLREALGKVSYLEVVTAESEMAARQRDLVVAQTNLRMREVDLKNAIGKQLDKDLGDAQIITTDSLPEPKDADVPNLDEALKQAQQNRAELRQAEININTQDVALKYEKNLLKPTLVAFAQFASNGLYGSRTLTDSTGKVVGVVPGGLWGVFRQVGSWNYPDTAVGFSLSINLRNRAPQADSYRAKMERQQSEFSLQRSRNSIGLEVRKAVIGLVQTKAQVQAAQKTVKLTGETLAAEEARLTEGVSTPYDVIRRQRDFRSAQFAEVQARANYAKALVELDRSTGALDSK